MKYCSIIIIVSVISIGFFSCGGGRQGGDQPDTTATIAAVDTVAPELNPEVFRERFERGIDFAATGNEPFWGLDISLDGKMYFNALDGPVIIAPTPEGVTSLDADTTSYTTESAQGSIVAHLIRQECTDTMSGAKSEYKVRVEILATANASPSTYEGCGRYLADPNLYNKWTLESINDHPLRAGDFAKGLPEIEFDPETKRAAGHSGCNNITGEIEVRGHQIVFKPMIATKMACPGMEFEHEYLRMLSGSVGYRVDDGRLHLQVSPDSIFTYRGTN